MDSSRGMLETVVIVVSLVHTIMNSFGSAHDLYKKVKRKADKTEEEVQRLKEKERRKSRSRGRHRRDSDDSDSDSDVDSIISESKSLVWQEYERGYGRIGRRFAVGDLIAQNQLQAQIIALQQTILTVFQASALHYGPAVANPMAHQLAKLLTATSTARVGSVKALTEQYQRMLTEGPLPTDLPPVSIETPAAEDKAEEVVDLEAQADRPPSPPHSTHQGSQKAFSIRTQSPTRSHHTKSKTQTPRTSRQSLSGPGHTRPPSPRRSKVSLHRSDSRDSAISTKSVANDAPNRHPHNFLFCIYALDLQNHPTQPLADAFRKGGNNRCSYCSTHIPVRAGSSWEITKDDRDAEKIFHIENRFIVKSHREGHGFACVLCAKNRKSSVDVICGSVKTLVEHVWDEHEVEDYKLEVDIREVGRGWRDV